MSTAVLLTGGWMHPPELSAPLVDLVGDRFDRLRVIDQPDDVPGALDEHPDLLAVNACWFAMHDERYSAEQRAEHAVHLSPTTKRSLDTALTSGVPLLAVHTAVLCFDGWSPWVDALGAEWNWATSFHPPPAEIAVEPVPEHPLSHAAFSLIDEEYQGLRLSPHAQPLARSSAGNPLAWTTEHGPGRVAVSLLGHGAASLENPHHQQLLNGLMQWLEEPHA